MSAHSNKVYREKRKAKGLPAVDPLVNQAQYQKRKAAGKVAPMSPEKRDAHNARRRALRLAHKNGDAVRIGKPKTNFLSTEERKVIKNQRAREKRAAERMSLGLKPHQRRAPAKLITKLTLPAVKTNPRKRIPKAEPRLCKTLAVPIEQRIKIWIPEIRAHVYIRDAENEQACRDRYINRSESKIGKL